jgi:hypothetical protein
LDISIRFEQENEKKAREAIKIKRRNISKESNNGLLFFYFNFLKTTKNEEKSPKTSTFLIEFCFYLIFYFSFNFFFFRLFIKIEVFVMLPLLPLSLSWLIWDEQAHR